MRHVQQPYRLRPLSGVSTGTRVLLERVIGPDMKKQHKGCGGERLCIRTFPPFDKRMTQQRQGATMHWDCTGTVMAPQNRVKPVFEELPSRGFEESLVGTPDCDRCGAWDPMAIADCRERIGDILYLSSHPVPYDRTSGSSSLYRRGKTLSPDLGGRDTCTV
jgi:hypothetical protein